MRDHAVGVTSEVGRLRTVLVHRPGDELRRLTPRNSESLLFDSLPWVDRARDEHDAFTDLLRGRGVRVLYFDELLVGALENSDGRREQVVSQAIDASRVGFALTDQLTEYLVGCAASDLARILVSGMTFDEIPATVTRTSLVRQMHHGGDFVIDPLPNLLFTRDSSFWVGDRVAIAALAMPARRREVQLTELIYRAHPLFADVPHAYSNHRAPVEGGDVLILAPGVLAVGVGERTSPAGVESLARNLFAEGLASAVLAVPITQSRATMHLDTVCTMVDRDAIVMFPEVADHLSAFALYPDATGSDLVVDDEQPFLLAAAAAMNIDCLRVIDTGLDPVTAVREQWDDGNNTLALAPGVVVAYERNVETNGRLTDAGIEVLAIAGTELGSGRGGPRCMSCPIWRED